MFKRLFWLCLGASLGATTSWWVTRKVRHQVERYLPTGLTERLAGAARSAKRDLRAAVADGRQAMQEEEGHLRAELEARLRPKAR